MGHFQLRRVFFTLSALSLLMPGIFLSHEVSAQLFKGNGHGGGGFFKKRGNGFLGIRNDRQNSQSCDQRVKDAIVKVQAGEGVGSGAVIEIGDNFSVPAGKYLLTATHVAQDPVSRAPLSSVSGEGIGTLDVSRSLCMPGGDKMEDSALLIPIDGEVSQKPFEISKSKKLKARQELKAYGFPKGGELDTFVSKGGSQSNGQGLAYMNPVDKVAITGQSGGPVVNPNCELVGVVSGFTDMKSESGQSHGTKNWFSSVHHLLTNGQSCFGGSGSAR